MVSKRQNSFNIRGPYVGIELKSPNLQFFKGVRAWYICTHVSTLPGSVFWEWEVWMNHICRACSQTIGNRNSYTDFLTTSLLKIHGKISSKLSLKEMAWELVCVGEWWSVICVCLWGITQPLCCVSVFFFFFFKGTNHNHASLLSIFLLSSKHHNIGCYFFLTPLSGFRILYNLPHQTPVVSLKFGFFYLFIF